MGELLPGEALIYERANGVVFARYRDKPEIPRWIIGGDPIAVSKAKGEIFDYGQWEDMMKEAETNSVLKKYLQKAVQAYYLTKED